MKDMEKREFEEEWKDAFNHAEASPSDNLWTNIELNLEKADTGKMKSMLLFYKLTAAASVIFAMCIGGVGFYYYSDKNSQTDIAQNSQVSTIKENTEHKANRAAQVDATAPVRKDRKGINRENSGTKTYQRNQAQERSTSSADFSKSIVSGDMEDNTSAQSKNLTKNHDGANNKLPGSLVYNSALTGKSSADINTVAAMQSVDKIEHASLRKLSERGLPLAVPVRSKPVFAEQDPVAVMMAKLEQREMELAGTDKTKDQKKSAPKNERLWTSVGFAAGTFNTVNQNTPPAAMASSFASSNVTTNQSKASGASYSVGMNLGTKLSERWVLQGGVNYLAQNSSYEANSVVGNADFTSYQAASINSLSPKNTLAQGSKLVGYVPYNVDNSVRFLSVPVQAGYLMVDHAVGLQINGGVSTDVFLQNKLSPQNADLPAVTQGSGEDSPYRTINFSGLLGTEISYRFSKHYRLAVNPGIRYPFNSIYKSEVGIRATPLTFDVGMRFRYIFH